MTNRKNTKINLKVYKKMYKIIKNNQQLTNT